MATAETTLPDLASLTGKLSAIQLRYAGLQGQARELLSRRTALGKQIGLDKAKIEMAPMVTEAFDYMQDKAHARAVGEFEDLLTAFVADVVPDAGKIHLELGTERGAPALDILVDNGGDLEDILLGNGGGLTNVVVTGLGYSALSRTSNRQFMLLDEPDCWLKSTYVPNFTKVIAEVANPRVDEEGHLQPGCQTLMVSHNDVSLMDEGAHLQNLLVERDLEEFAARWDVPVMYKGEVNECAYVVWVPGSGADKGHIEVRYREDGLGDEEQNALTKGFPRIDSVSGARPWSDDLPGIRWIEVENLRRHVKTRLELSPGLNVLTGDINGGKSTLYFTAMRAMAYGETDERMIRHGADSAVVRIGIENDVVLEMVRSRKGSPKVLYRRYEAGVLVNEGRPETRGGNGVPAFIADALQISPVDGLDIQLRSQKQPVFLLNEPPARRAQLLSVGRESGLLQELIERHRQELRRARENVKRDELEYTQLSRTLTVLAPLAGMAALNDLLTNLASEAKAQAEAIHRTRALLTRLGPLELRIKLQEQQGAVLEHRLSLPNCHDTASLARRLDKLQRTRLVGALPDCPELPVVPKVHDTFRLRQIGRQLVFSERAMRLGTLLPILPALPEIRVTAPLLKGVEKLVGLEKIVATRSAEEKEAAQEERAARESLPRLIGELGVCPVLQKAIEGETESCVKSKATAASCSLATCIWLVDARVAG